MHCSTILMLYIIVYLPRAIHCSCQQVVLPKIGNDAWCPTKDNLSKLEITKMHKNHIMLSFNKPLSLVRVSTPRVSSSNASRWTMTRRSSSISAVRSIISGGASTDQLQHEMATLSDAERHELLANATPLQVSAEETLATLE